jgi:hypothetical protein
MMWPLRILAFGGALGLIDPALVTDLIGLGVLAIVILVQRMVFKKEKAAKGLQAG